MKFTVSRDVLAEAVNWTARTVPSRPSSPILAGIRIKAENETLSLSSFDYETSAHAEVQAQVEQSGDILIQGRQLASIAKALPNRDVDCAIVDNKLIIKCGSSRFALANMNVEDYPTLPAVPAIKGKIDAQVFAQTINQVSVAAASDETIALLTGIRMEIEGDTITLLATDRYRLAMRTFQWEPAEPGISAELLVKAKTLNDVAKNMAVAGEVEVAFNTGETAGQSLIGFRAGGRHTTSTLMEGEYPPVRRLFPENTETTALVNRADLLEAVKRVSLVAEQKTSLRLVFTAGQVVLEAGQDDNAQATEIITAQLNGKEIRTAFNPQYLQAGLSALTSQYVRFSFTDAAKPAVLTGQSEPLAEDDPSFRYLLMPIRFGI
ncbi:DNA polymerase III subunit beta [Gleimia sp. 6138-11-ORH1]|uniref:DNA polymerase III subunit beta n=1 Tax=Gleimia sp. 6138-11-ORH1 TaxID=2973937 RepID=UPI0021681F81|nr:DNA polymerase III subunit beta [Gleimia sp. 6138-11-ORH1]MCS4485128.1 DNA polymerase III subunit beta [Gleimia sp. 6138-11-ORH1]